jgi:hypothetical protein
MCQSLRYRESNPGWPGLSRMRYHPVPETSTKLSQFYCNIDLINIFLTFLLLTNECSSRIIFNLPTQASQNMILSLCKTFKISIVWPGKSLNVLSCWPGQIYILIYLANYFTLNFSWNKIPVHTLVKSDVDICPVQI